MRILQILPELNVGGVETGTVDFAKYLCAHRHASFVISNGGALVSELEKAGTKHFVLPVHKKSIWTAWSMVKAVRQIILRERVDIVHARSRVPAWIAYFACKGTGASFITTCHGYYKSKLFSQVMGWAKYVIVPSQVIARHMIEDFHVRAANIRCIPRSVDLDKFRDLQSGKEESLTKVIAIIGRITPLKGHTYFLKAVARVIREYDNVKVWIIGDAPANKEAYKHDLEFLVKRLGLVSRVEFLGNRSDVPTLLGKIDVLVLSTITQESFGRVILEAQAAGIPVVATQVGGVVDIIDHEETGLLVMPKDTEAMAAAILRTFREPALVQKMKEGALKKLREKFTLDRMAAETIKVYEELLRSTNILVIKIGAVGDVILVTASLRALRKKFPYARIFCLVGREARKVLHKCPYLDGLILLDHKGGDKGWWRLLKFSRKLRKYRFDTVVDFQNNHKSHVLGFLSFPNASYGYDRKWGMLLTHRIREWRKDLSAVEHQFQLLSHLDIRYRPEDTYLELWPSEKDVEDVNDMLNAEWIAENHPLVGINVAASEKWETKNWPVEYIARLCDLLSRQGIRTVLTGLPKERERTERILAQTKAKPANLVGKTDIMQLAVLIRRCQAYVTPDSAPLHVAAAVKTPVVAFFGPTDSRRHSPPAGRLAVLEKKLSCAPCYSPKCQIATHACMREITPEEVLAEVRAFMGVPST